jgi:hypothetical protein
MSKKQPPPTPPVMRRADETLEQWRAHQGRWNKHAAKTPGRYWRVSTEGGGRYTPQNEHDDFDELVVQPWFHMERMDDRGWWIRIGDLTSYISIEKDGSVKMRPWEKD